MRQSVNQPPPYLNQQNQPQYSGYYPVPVHRYPVQQRVVFQDNVQTLHKYWLINTFIFNISLSINRFIFYLICYKSKKT